MQGHKSRAYEKKIKHLINLLLSNYKLIKCDRKQVQPSIFALGAR